MALIDWRRHYYADDEPAPWFWIGILWLLLVLLAPFAVGCSSSPTAPTPPVAPACQTQNTAQLRFENTSASRFTYDVFVDSAAVATIAPTVVSTPVTVVAGVQHAVRFFVTNTTVLACTVNPIPVQCSQTSYFCTF